MSKANGNPKGGSKPPANTPVNKTQQWSKSICAAADGSGTIAGFQALGPLASPQDLLVTAATSGNPQCVLAAEQVIHLVEGWRYAAAATSAYLAHSNAAATHFAYYAELRAATSLFAWSGIRAKWHKYYYLDASGAKVVPQGNPPTHQAVWALWTEWVTRPDIQTLMSQQIKLHPLVSMDKVVNAISFSRPGQVLKAWGADLVNVSNDHTARNDASYEATWLHSPLSQMSVDEAELIREVWRLFLADGSGLGFDAALCNYLVEQSVSQETLGNQTPADIRTNIVKHIAANSGASELEIARRLDASLYPRRPFELAADAATLPQNVLSRSFLLLRMALLALKSSLSVPGMPVVAKSWLENWLEHAGIWSQSAGVDPIDIEIDYRDAVLDLNVARPLPASLWEGVNQARFALVARPDACIAWSLVA
ncbi:hypothetical protein [Pandoraea pnomenusa]|uniref:hypothetical protein n=1 Tax=Pandoraea pnomenusa TaxID=93220 RepID=UPI00242B7D19|nr:hypothetical protein [Pandoraea pnomenusa]